MAWDDFMRGARNVAYELSGAGDISRGVKEIAKGNVAGGIGRLALGGIGLIPGAGIGAKVATKAVQAVAKGTKVGKPGVITQITKATSKGVVPAKTKVGSFASAATTSPYWVSRTASTYTNNQPKPVQASASGVGNLPAYDDFSAKYSNLYQPTVSTSQQTKSTGGTKQTGGNQSSAGAGGAGAAGTAGGGDLGLEDLRGKSGSLGGSAEDVGTGGAGAAGTTPLPGSVQAAGQDYLADLAGSAARSRIRQFDLADLFSRDVMSARSTAADVYGGRAPAIRGQALTGAGRSYTQDLATEAQRQVSDFGALERSYGKAVAEAYAAEAKKIKDSVEARSNLVAQMKGIG